MKDAKNWQPDFILVSLDFASQFVDNMYLCVHSLYYLVYLLPGHFDKVEAGWSQCLQNDNKHRHIPECLQFPSPSAEVNGHKWPWYIETVWFQTLKFTSRNRTYQELSWHQWLYQQAIPFTGKAAGQISRLIKRHHIKIGFNCSPVKDYLILRNQVSYIVQTLRTIKERKNEH